VEVERSVTLDPATASRLGLEPGKIYEIALFHAERHVESSNFNLTLQGFVPARSKCEPRCGDGVVAGRETCDDGKNAGDYGSCTKDCQRAAFCGDGHRDQPQEACDDGLNITAYSATGKPGCAPGCVPSAFCGDGQVDSAAGEKCDEGNNTGKYGHCAKGCVFGPRCGDGALQPEEGEACDDGNQISGDGCSKRCQSEAPG
jgi:cysteine-rich repeat protein